MRELGIDGFGIFNVVAGFVTMLGFIGTTMTTGIQRFFNYEIGKNGEDAAVSVYSSAIKIQFYISVIIFLLFETVGLWYVNSVMKLPPERVPEVNGLYQFAIVSLLLNVMVVPFNAFVISKEHMNFYAIVSIAENVLKLAIAYSLSLFQSYRLVVYGVLLMLVAVLNFVCYILFCKKYYPGLKYIRVRDNKMMKSILEFSGWNAVSAFANIGRGQGVNLLINYFFGVAVNAANAIVTQIYSAVQLFATNICMAFRPQLTESYARGDYRTAKTMFFDMSKFAFAMVMAICIPLYLELPFIFNIWLGENIPEHTELFTKITLGVVLIGSLNTPVSIVIFANGNIRQYILAYSSMCLCIPFGWIAYRLGAEADSVFYITLALMTIVQLWSLAILRNYLEYEYSDYLKSVISPIALFVLLAPVLPSLAEVLLNIDGIVKFLIVGLADVLSCSLIFLYGVLSRKQRAAVFTKLRNVIAR